MGKYWYELVFLIECSSWFKVGIQFHERRLFFFSFVHFQTCFKVLFFFFYDFSFHFFSDTYFQITRRSIALIWNVYTWCGIICSFECELANWESAQLFWLVLFFFLVWLYCIELVAYNHSVGANTEDFQCHCTRPRARVCESECECELSIRRKNLYYQIWKFFLFEIDTNSRTYNQQRWYVKTQIPI